MILFLAARPVTAPPVRPTSAVRPAPPVRPAPRRRRARLRPPARLRPFAPYRRIFAVPGTRAFTAANLLARLPMGMLSISAVLMIAGSRGSYALAGAVTATGLAATALAGPWTARLIDRYGQSRIAVPATALATLGSLALLLCVHYGAPDWTLFASYAATATTPNTGGMSRARWAHLFRDDPAARHTANSFEQAADELCFLLGPLLATLLCTTLFPEAGTAVAAALLLTGVLLFAAQRRTEPRSPPAPQATPPPALPCASPASRPSSAPSSAPARSSAPWRWSPSPTPTPTAYAPPEAPCWPSRRPGPARPDCSTGCCGRRPAPAAASSAASPPWRP